MTNPTPFLSTLPLFKAYPTDAGFDIVSAEDYTFYEFGESHLFSTNLYIALPAGTYGRIASRSGLAVKKGIEVGAGVIDCGYRSEVKVLLRLLEKSPKPVEIKKGDAIAQLIVTLIWQGEVQVTTDLPPADRGMNGFGSSDVKIM